MWLNSLIIQLIHSSNTTPQPPGSSHYPTTTSTTLPLPEQNTRPPAPPFESHSQTPPHFGSHHSKPKTHHQTVPPSGLQTLPPAKPYYHLNPKQYYHHSQTVPPFEPQPNVTTIPTPNCTTIRTISNHIQTIPPFKPQFPPLVEPRSKDFVARRDGAVHLGESRGKAKQEDERDRVPEEREKED